MEDSIRTLVEESIKYIDTADHFIYTTFPMIKDKKLFVTIAQNIYNANLKAMEAILEYDKLYKRIPFYDNNFTVKLEFFKNKCAPRYGIPQEHAQIIEYLKSFLEARESAPVEFQRNDKYVICSSEFQTQSLTIEKLKNLLTQSKLFIERVNKTIPTK